MGEVVLRSPELPNPDKVAFGIAAGLRGDASAMTKAMNEIEEFRKSAKYLTADRKSMRPKEQAMLDGFLANVSNILHNKHHLLPNLRLTGLDGQNHLLQAVDSSKQKHWIDKYGQGRTDGQYKTRDIQTTTYNLGDCLANRTAAKVSDYEHYCKRLTDQLKTLAPTAKQTALVQVNQMLRQSYPGIEKLGVVVGASNEGLLFANPANRTIGMITSDFVKCGLVQMSTIPPITPSGGSFGNPDDHNRYPNRNPQEPQSKPIGDRIDLSDEALEELQQNLERNKLTATKLQMEAQAAANTQRRILLTGGAIAIIAAAPLIGTTAAAGAAALRTATTIARFAPAF